MHRNRFSGRTVILAALIVLSQPAIANSPADTATVKRGKYLVETGGCHDCHTPLAMGKQGPEPDMRRALSGHPAGLKVPSPPKLDQHWVWVGNSTNTAFAGPWGITYAVNLTSDRETGIGNWKAEDFVKAMKTGKHLGVGRPIMPPMPWQAYGAMEEAELKAMFAYLQSTSPVKNRVPDYQPPAPPAKK